MKNYQMTKEEMMKNEPEFWTKVCYSVYRFYNDGDKPNHLLIKKACRLLNITSVTFYNKYSSAHVDVIPELKEKLLSLGFK